MANDKNNKVDPNYQKSQKSKILFFDNMEPTTLLFLYIIFG